MAAVGRGSWPTTRATRMTTGMWAAMTPRTRRSRVVDAAAGMRGLRCWTWCYGDCSVGTADRISGVRLNVG